MVTNYPHAMAAHHGLRATASHAPTGGFGRRVLVQLRQMFCGFGGHDTLMHFEEERMSLLCVSCGHETPGWELNEVPPTVTVRGDPRRHAVARPQLVSSRRIA
jgi:hypothetical protein